MYKIQVLDDKGDWMDAGEFPCLDSAMWAMKEITKNNPKATKAKLFDPNGEMVAEVK